MAAQRGGGGSSLVGGGLPSTSTSNKRSSNPTQSAQQDSVMRAQEAEDAARAEVSGVPDEQDQAALEEDQEEDDLQIGAEGQGELFEGLQDEQGMPVEGDEEEEEEEEDEEEYESSSQSGTESLTWISWYCSLPGHEYFAEVGEDFIEDDFNLTGLSQLVPFYKEALEMVLDVEPEDEAQKIPDMSIVESSAELLYGLIHQRYIITRQGLQQMVAKYESAHFGYCPRVYCNQTKVLPSGRSDLPGVDGVKLFCPTCLDTYTPPSSRFNGVDGAFFGTTFPHLLFQQHPELVPPLNSGKSNGGAAPTSSASSSASPAPTKITDNASTGSMSGVETATTGAEDTSEDTPWTDSTTSAAKLYIPRIYGFKVSERARSGPRMSWLRLRPQDPKELDRVNSQGRWLVTDPADQLALNKDTASLSSTNAVAPATAGPGPMSGMQKSPAASTTTTAAPAPEILRQPRSRQKLSASAAAGGQGGRAVSPARGGGGAANNDDQLPPRRATQAAAAQGAANATATSSAAQPQPAASPRAGGGQQPPQPSPGRARR